MTIEEMLEHLAAAGVQGDVIQRVGRAFRRLAEADNHPLVMQEGGTDAIDRCLRVINKQAAEIKRLRWVLAPEMRPELWQVLGCLASGDTPTTIARAFEAPIISIRDALHYLAAASVDALRARRRETHAALIASEYPTRCRIVDATGQEVLPGVMGQTPDESKPHIGKEGLAELTADRLNVRITLDDGTILMGYDCWWVPILEQGE